MEILRDIQFAKDIKEHLAVLRILLDKI